MFQESINTHVFQFRSVWHEVKSLSQLEIPLSYLHVTECINVKVASTALLLTFTALLWSGVGLKLDRSYEQIQVL